jgi:hypothetical protein
LKQHYANVARNNYDLHEEYNQHSPYNNNKSKEFQFPRENNKMEFIDHYDEVQNRKK